MALERTSSWARRRNNNKYIGPRTEEPKHALVVRVRGLQINHNRIHDWADGDRHQTVDLRSPLYTWPALQVRYKLSHSVPRAPCYKKVK